MKHTYIEASSFYGNRSGVGRYGLSVSEALIQNRPDDKFVLFNFLRPGRNLTRDFSLPSNVRYKHIRWFPGRAFSLLMRKGISLPLELFGLFRADILIFPNFIAWASIIGKKRVSVVHDIAFEFYPEHVQVKNLEYLRSQLAKSLRRSDKIIAVSLATKRDLIAYYGVDSAKIEVIHNAVDRTIFRQSANVRTADTCKKFGITGPYILFVGNVEPRKNLESLLRAYARSYEQHHASLVIVGAKGWNDSGITRRLEEVSGLPIHQTNFVNDTELAALYAGAIAFVFPSLYEGFGIPCLEAMASGCPVICSNTSSLPEVVGDAAITINPNGH